MAGEEKYLKMKIKSGEPFYFFVNNPLEAGELMEVKQVRGSSTNQWKIPEGFSIIRSENIDDIENFTSLLRSSRGNEPGYIDWNVVGENNVFKPLQTQKNQSVHVCSTQLITPGNYIEFVPSRGVYLAIDAPYKIVLVRGEILKRIGGLEICQELSSKEELEIKRKSLMLEAVV